MTERHFFCFQRGFDQKGSQDSTTGKHTIGKKSDRPVILEGRYGKGKAAYSTVLHIEIFNGTVVRATPPNRYRTVVPKNLI